MFEVSTVQYLTVIISTALMTIVMPLLLLFVLGILLLLYVLKCGLYEPDVQEARIGRSQPGVGL